MRKLFPSARVLTNLYGIIHLLLALGVFIYLVNDASPEKGYTGMGIILGLLTLPHNCGQSEKLVKELEEDCHGITKKEFYPGI